MPLLCSRRTFFSARNILSGLIFLLLAPSFSSENNIHRFTPGAQAIGLGYSGILENVDASALFWNPAALAVLRAPQAFFSIHEPFTLNYAGYAHFIPRIGTFAGSVATGWNDASQEQQISAGWGIELSPTFSVGINLTGHDYQDQTAMSLGLGMLYRPTRNIRRTARPSSSQSPLMADRLSLALTLFNIPLGQQLAEHQIRLGFSYKILQAGPSIIYAHHFSSTDDTDHLGLLFHPASYVQVYAGMLNFDARYFSFGGGFEFDNIRINITYDALTERLVLSTGIRIGKQPQQIAEDYYNQAIDALRDRDKKEALRLSQLSQTFDRNNTRAFNLEKRLEPFIQRENQTIDSLLVTARSFESQGIFLSAAAQYLKILKIDPQNNEAREAIAMIRPRVNLDVERWYQQAVEAYNDGKIERAEELFEAIILVRPDHFGAKNYLVKIQSYYTKMAEQHYYAGLGYYSQRKLDLAEESFNKALDINPNLEEASNYISRIKNERSQNRDQISTLLAEAQERERNQQWRSALETYREILKIQPDYALALKKQQELDAQISSQAERYFDRGKTAYDNGDYKRALDFFNQALALKPTHSAARRYKNTISNSQSGRLRQYVERARTFAEQQNWQQSLAMADSALALDASYADAIALKSEATKQLDVETLMRQAQAEYFAGRYLEALQLFTTILQKDPGNVLAQSRLESCQTELNSQVDKMFSNGIQLFTEDKYQEAINFFDTVLKINPYHKGALDYKQRAQERLDIIKNLP